MKRGLGHPSAALRQQLHAVVYNTIDIALENHATCVALTKTILAGARCLCVVVQLDHRNSYGGPTLCSERSPQSKKQRHKFRMCFSRLSLSMAEHVCSPTDVVLGIRNQTAGLQM